MQISRVSLQKLRLISAAVRVNMQFLCCWKLRNQHELEVPRRAQRWTVVRHHARRTQARTQHAVHAGLGRVLLHLRRRSAAGCPPDGRVSFEKDDHSRKRGRLKQRL